MYVYIDIYIYIYVCESKCVRGTWGGIHIYIYIYIYVYTCIFVCVCIIYRGRKADVGGMEKNMEIGILATCMAIQRAR